MSGRRLWTAVFSARRLRSLLLWAACGALLFLVYGLYGLPRGPALYTALLCALLAGAAGVRSMLLERGRLLRLRLLRGGADSGELPKAADPVERAYQEIISALEERCRRAEEKARRDAAGAVQYYTLWSHQIKTPIAAMRLLLQEDEPDRSAVEQELFKTEQYVEMVLQYQRLGGGGRDLVFAEYPLEPLVRQAAKRIAALFIRRKISFAIVPADAAAVTDEKWMVFVLEQILTNAAKYTPSGGSVTVAVGPPAEIVISDTGIGIRPEDLPRVTEWGYTGYNGRLDRRSTGIGLWLCRQVLDMLGHEMRIESEVGKGTAVTLDLFRRRLEVE